LEKVKNKKFFRLRKKIESSVFIIFGILIFIFYFNVYFVIKNINIDNIIY